MTKYKLQITNEKISINITAGRQLSIIHRQLSVLLFILFLLPLISCGRSKARHRLAQDKFFIEILKRENHRWIGEDKFLENCLLTNTYPEVRQWSAIALGRIASPRALPLLYKSLKTGDTAVRAASAFAIGEIEDRGLPVSVPNPEAVTELIRALDDHSIIVRMRAVEALGKIGSHSEAVEIVGRLKSFPFRLTPTEREYFRSSITALGKLGDPIARPVIERLADSSDRDIKGRALEALIHIGSKASDPPLMTPGLQEDYMDPPRIPLPDAFCRVLAVNRKNSTIARLETNRGTIEIALFREDAPVTVANFVLMANGGDYNGMELERVIAHPLIEGKSLKTQAGQIRTIPGEVNMRSFERGSVGMGLINGNSETGRFFIALTHQPYLDGIHTCFGRVVSGMQLVDRIVPGDYIRQVVIKESISFLNYQSY